FEVTSPRSTRSRRPVTGRSTSSRTSSPGRSAHDNSQVLEPFYRKFREESEASHLASEAHRMAPWFRLLIMLMVAGLGLGAGDVEASSTLDLLGVGWAQSQVTVLINAGRGVSAQAVSDVASAGEDWSNILSQAAGLN